MQVPSLTASTATHCRPLTRPPHLSLPDGPHLLSFAPPSTLPYFIQPSQAGFPFLHPSRRRRRCSGACRLSTRSLTTEALVVFLFSVSLSRFVSRSPTAQRPPRHRRLHHLQFATGAHETRFPATNLPVITQHSPLHGGRITATAILSTLASRLHRLRPSPTVIPYSHLATLFEHPRNHDPNGHSHHEPSSPPTLTARGC